MSERKRTARRPAYSRLVDDLLAETAATAAATAASAATPSSALKPTFPPATEFDEFGFDVRTGAAGFEIDDPVRIALPSGRPPKG